MKREKLVVSRKGCWCSLAISLIAHSFAKTRPVADISVFETWDTTGGYDSCSRSHASDNSSKKSGFK
jgi:hypothetical protein